MPSSLGKTWYMNNQTNKIYRLEGYAYAWNSGDKSVILKDIDNGHRWVLPISDLYKETLINDKPRRLWEEMPDGWHPIGEEKQYAGYTNDARKDYNYDNIPTQRHNNRSSYANPFDRGYNSFKR